MNLFERQVEIDGARLQKGEITLTDLAQSESSLAGANANLINAQTELYSSKRMLKINCSQSSSLGKTNSMTFS